MLKSNVFGKTNSGLPILSYHFGTEGPPVLILGGVHGDEVEGVAAAMGLIDKWSQIYTRKLNITVVPSFNVDGVLSGQRKNLNGVDLNRNLPTQDWTNEVAKEKYFPGTKPNSEPENQALVSWISSNKPKFILSLHSWKPCLNVNGNCKPEAEAIRAITEYPIVEDIGYPTPGCLGTYASVEHDIPTLTYEIERGLDTKSILSTHIDAVSEALKVFERKF